MDPGFAYIDNLHIWQNLHSGTTARIATSYLETADTKQFVATPSTPSGYRHAFSVSAYKYERDNEGDIIDYIMSAWSDPYFPDGGAEAGIVRTHTYADAAPAYNISGRRAATSDRLIIRQDRKTINVR